MFALKIFASSVLCASGDRPPTALGNYGVVSASHGDAARAGVAMLEAGGSAADAAVAVQLALAVVEFQHVSLLGGGTMLFKSPGGIVEQIDFREEAPAAYHPNVFCKNEACLLDPACDCSEGAVASSERCVGGLTVGVPGVPALIARLVEDGLTTFPLEVLAGPAIELAEDGFVMYEMLHATINDKASTIARDDAASEIFLNADRSAAKVLPGELFKQPLLAATLRRFFTSLEGMKSVYNGVLADEIVQAASNAVNPTTKQYGLLTSEDMQGYRAVKRDPVHFSHTVGGLSYNISGAGMPFSGPATVSLILGLLQRLNPRSDDPARQWGYFIDAQNAGFADRNKYMADADFVDVPLEALLSEDYVDARYEQLFPADAPDVALQVPVAPGSPGGSSPENFGRSASYTPDHGTSHFSIVHADGTVLGATTTVNSLMGSRVAVPGRGMILNDELCDFDALGFDSDGVMRVNAPEGGKRLRRSALGSDASSKGGKRPRSSMTPVIVEAPQGAVFKVAAVGAPGGTDIIGGVANVLRRILDPQTFRSLVDLQAMTDAPRAIGKNNNNGSSGLVELALWDDVETTAALQGLGYDLEHAGPPPYTCAETFSRVQTAMMGPSGDLFAGAADSLRFTQCLSVAASKPEDETLV